MGRMMQKVPISSLSLCVDHDILGGVSNQET